MTIDTATIDTATNVTVTVNGRYYKTITTWDVTERDGLERARDGLERAVEDLEDGSYIAAAGWVDSGDTYDFVVKNWHYAD